MSTTNGPVEVAVPRDRDGTFKPRIVPKHARRLGNIDDMILRCIRGESELMCLRGDIMV